MYGNIEGSAAGQGQPWDLGPGGGEACGALCPAEENPYEPLDPIAAAPSPKPAADPPSASWAWPRPVTGSSTRPRPGAARPPSGRCPRGTVLLAGAVALGVSVLLNVVLLAVGSRHLAALTEELEAEKAKELPDTVAAPTKELEAEKTKELPEMASRSFLIYNQHQDKCVEARGHQLTATACRPEAAAQRFQWLAGGRLRSAASGRCATAASEGNLEEVALEPCRAGEPRQRWECRTGGLLALAGSGLYFNYGNSPRRTVMLYSGDREWSRWLAHGTAADVCSRSCCPPCSKGWSYFQNSCYFYSKTPSSWENARSFCATLGAQLLEVDGPEEKRHVRAMLQSSSWLGIRDEELEGTWKRANGTLLGPGSSSWHRDEPNGGRQENCAVVREDGEWYDYPCSSHLPWVCEGPP